MTGSEPPALQRSRVVLVGFMCAGKSSVGGALARRLKWDHIDIDHRIEGETGHRIAEIFARGGEAAFRALEREATQEIARRHHCVVSTGGGWASNEGCWQMLAHGSFFVWLRVGREMVLSRAKRSATDRPLLHGAVPGAIDALLARRTPDYARAHVALDVGFARPAQLAGTIASLMREYSTCPGGTITPPLRR